MQTHFYKYSPRQTYTPEVCSLSSRTWSHNALKIMAAGCCCQGPAASLLQPQQLVHGGPSEEQPIWRGRLSGRQQRQAESRLPSQPEQPCLHFVLKQDSFVVRCLHSRETRNSSVSAEIVSSYRYLEACDLRVAERERCFAVNVNEVWTSWSISQSIMQTTLSTQDHEQKAISAGVAMLNMQKVTSWPISLKTFESLVVMDWAPGTDANLCVKWQYLTC